jgi:hypothetical protein
MATVAIVLVLVLAGVGGAACWFVEALEGDDE